MQNGNSFTYEGNTYKVRSVVLYELENNMTQIWMSETAGTEVFFDDGEEFRLRNSYGNILLVPSAESISISLKLTNEGGKTLAAEYEGAYRYRYGYNGKFELNEAAVNVDMNQTPTLKVSRDVLNEGELTDQIF